MSIRGLLFYIPWQISTSQYQSLCKEYIIGSIITVRVLFQLKSLFVLCLCLGTTRQTLCGGVGEREDYKIETQRTRFSAVAINKLGPWALYLSRKKVMVLGGQSGLLSSE